jgi:alkylhydroperoxidase family enzyme
VTPFTIRFCFRSTGRTVDRMLRKSNHAGTPRVAPVTPPYTPEIAAALEPLGPPIALFRLFARRPDRARGILGWGRYYLSRQSALSLRHRELVIDRTTALCGAEYEWAIHVDVFAAKAALTAAEIRSLTAGSADDPCWRDHPADRAVLRAVDALHDRSDLTDPEWSDLLAATGEDGAIDLMLLTGWYHAISYVARATRLPPEPGTPTFAGVLSPDGA